MNIRTVKKISVQTVSNVNRDELAIELWGDDIMIGEVVSEGNKRKLLFYSSPDSSNWKLDLNEFVAALETAKHL